MLGPKSQVQYISEIVLDLGQIVLLVSDNLHIEKRREISGWFFSEVIFES